MSSHHQRQVLPVSDAVRAKSSGLPAELLERGTVRLRLTAIVTLLVSSFPLLLPLVAEIGDRFGVGIELEFRKLFFGVALLLSAIVVVLSFVRMPPARFMVIGQIFFVLLVATFGATEASSEWGPRAFAHGMPLPCGVVLMFAVVVPMAPRRIIVVSLLAVATTPLTMLTVPLLVGIPTPGFDVLLLNLAPMIIAAVVAYATASVLYQLGRDLGRAQKMGSYQLVSMLSKGGMGEVWRAKHGMLAREAAIKLVRRDREAAGAEEALKRFEHEARVVASLRSPHTVQLYDFGVTDEGALYYAMELLDGMDLERLVELHGPVPPERVVHFLLQACDSLVEAHEAALVHRDIKPANLFAARHGRNVDVIKVLDFGLATRPLNEPGAGLRVTHEGAILGTPAYMAPEQVLGEKSLDGRADIYTLGLVGWWLLTGRDTFQATSATQVMFAHAHVEPERPSMHAKHPVPSDLEAIIMQCLAKPRDARPPNAEALAALLRNVPLAEPWTRERALRWWSSHGSGPAQSEGTAAALLDTSV